MISKSNRFVRLLAALCLSILGLLTPTHSAAEADAEGMAREEAARADVSAEAGEEADDGAEAAEVGAAPDAAEVEEAEEGEEDDPSAEAGPSVPSLDLPQLDLPTGTLPGAEGLQAPASESKETITRSRPPPPEFSVESVEHAGGYRTTSRGCVARGRLEGFVVDAFPADIQPFATCLRLGASRAVRTRLQARILAPGGEEVADASGSLSFEGEGELIDFVIEWVGFPAPRDGDYEMVLELDGSEVERVPLEVSTE